MELRIEFKQFESLINFLKEIVGKPLVDSAGILYADAIKAKRISNSLKLEQKYNLVKSEKTKPTELSFGYRLLEKATLEEDDYLLTKWANLLANATDRGYSYSIRKIFIKTLENLEPIDVKTFDDINKKCLSLESKYETLINLKNPSFLKEESLNVLLSQGLITYGYSTTPGIVIGNHAPTTFFGLDKFRVTEMGQSFYKSVSR